MMQNSGLRICVASTGLGHVTRGAEAWASDLGKSLAQRGENVVLCKGAGSLDADYERVIPCWTRGSARTRRLLGCVPNAIGWRIGLGSAYSIEQSTFAWNLISILRKERIDILHVMDPQAAVVIQHAQRAGLCPTQTILGHGTEEPPEFLQRLTFVQHLAPWHQEQAEAGQIGHQENWVTIPNFIDTNQFAPGSSPGLRSEWSIPIDAQVVLVSSAIKKAHKRVDYLIDEVALVRQRRPDLPVWLVIAGARERDTDELVDKAKRVLGDRVRFAIQFPRDRMPELYRMADVLAHGSLFEMFGTVLIEAMASGVPCIVHEHPVMKWVIGPGGMATDLSTEGNLADALIEVLDDRGKREQIGLLARRHCHQTFRKEIVVEQMIRYYQRVVDHKQVAA